MPPVPSAVPESPARAVGQGEEVSIGLTQDTYTVPVCRWRDLHTGELGRAAGCRARDSDHTAQEARRPTGQAWLWGLGFGRVPVPTTDERSSPSPNPSQSGLC